MQDHFNKMSFISLIQGPKSNKVIRIFKDEHLKLTLKPNNF